eukprot:gene1043-10562_t
MKKQTSPWQLITAVSSIIILTLGILFIPLSMTRITSKNLPSGIPTNIGLAFGTHRLTIYLIGASCIYCLTGILGIFSSFKSNKTIGKLFILSFACLILFHVFGMTGMFIHFSFSSGVILDDFKSFMQYLLILCIVFGIIIVPAVPCVGCLLCGVKFVITIKKDEDQFVNEEKEVVPIHSPQNVHYEH